MWVNKLTTKSNDAVANGKKHGGIKWNFSETRNLIELAEARPYLWYNADKDYHLRDKRETAYIEIEEELSLQQTRRHCGGRGARAPTFSEKNRPYFSRCQTSYAVKFSDVIFVGTKDSAQ